MKKLLITVLCLLLICGLSACGGSIKRSGVYEEICGLPTNFKELGLAANLNLREIADSCAISAGSFR